MLVRKCLLLCVLTGIVAFGGRPSAQGPVAAFYGIGQLSGLRAQPASLVRDATQVGGVIYAVGGATTRECFVAGAGGCGDTDTAVLWRFDGTNPATLDALPNIAVNTLSTTSLTAYTITDDADFHWEPGTNQRHQRTPSRPRDHQLFDEPQPPHCVPVCYRSHGGYCHLQTTEQSFTAQPTKEHSTRWGGSITAVLFSTSGSPRGALSFRLSLPRWTPGIRLRKGEARRTAAWS